MTKALFDRLFHLSPLVRYVAVYRYGVLESRVRPGLDHASSSESDKYEELLVNPALLTLVRQRGNIDCGGAQYVLVRYGNFYEYVQAVEDGHISVGLETGGDPIELACGIQGALRAWSEDSGPPERQLTKGSAHDRRHRPRR